MILCGRTWNRDLIHMTDSFLRDAWQSLYSDHHDWLYRWLHRRLGCEHNAADLAHDTFARIIALQSLLPACEPRAYLVTTAKRLIIDQARRHRIEQAYLAELALATAADNYPSSEQIVVAVQSLERIAKALDGLGAKPRTVFLLHYFEGASHAVMADHLGVSTRMTQKYLAEALMHCYQTLDT